MRIKFTAASPKSGQVEHCDNTAGRALILAGFAVEVKYANYRERLAAEHASASGHGSVDPSVVSTEWGVQDKAQSSQSQVLIIKRKGCETTFFSAPPADCPPSILARWSALTNQQNPSGVDLVQEKYRQHAQQAEEKKGVLATIFGGGK